MMSRASLKPLAAIAACVVLSSAGVAVQGRQQDAAKGSQEKANAAPVPAAAAGLDMAANQALAKEQLALIDEALDVLQTMVRSARMSPADPAFSLWGRRKLETIRRTGAAKTEVVAALEKYIDALKEEEEIAKARH